MRRREPGAAEPIRLAANYSPQAASLLAAGEVELDLFKCPPWPELVAAARERLPTCVHFDFQAGRGEPEEARLEEAERFLGETATPFVNAHLTPLGRDLPDAGEAARRDWIFERAVADLRPLTRRFGPERVLLENVPWERREDYEIDWLAADPGLLGRVVEASGCRLLLDLAHARFAAEELGVPTRAYIEALPLERLAELHATGLGLDREGRRRDHMPMDTEDLSLLAWALRNIASGAWPRPWTLALEYGGVGPLFAWRSDPDVLRKDLGNLRKLLEENHLRLRPRGATHFAEPTSPEVPPTSQSRARAEVPPDSRRGARHFAKGASHFARPRLLLIGGPDVDARIELMERLRPEFDCAAVGSSEGLRPRFEAADFPFWSYRLTPAFSAAGELRSLAELWRICREARPGIVHCFDTRPAIVGRLAARLAGVGVVLATLPGLGGLYTYDTPRVRRLRGLFRRLHRLSARLSSHTVFQNPDDRGLFVSEGIVRPEASSVIAGSGVSARRFAPRAEERECTRRELGVAPGEKIVLTVARLIRAKGLLDLARAAEILHGERSDLHWLLAGSWEPEAADALAPEELEGLRAHVRWLGPRTDVPRLLAAADVFAFPSFYREGVPRALVEAAFAGLPVVTTDSVGCREVVADGESGRRVPPGREELLAAALRETLADEEGARAMAEAARRRALERFELGPVAAAHAGLYRRLLARRTKVSPATAAMPAPGRPP